VGRIPPIHLDVRPHRAGHSGGEFDHALDAKKKATGAKSDTDLTPKALQELVPEFKEIVRRETKEAFPTEPSNSCARDRGRVRSWFGRRASTTATRSRSPTTSAPP
jgi:pyruvate,orthophosphate dikinase